jgi:hypothetical protein
VYDDGSGPVLFAAGSFTRAGIVPVNNIARWDGSTWSDVSGGLALGTVVNALAVYDDGSGPALYAGGHFYVAGGLPVNGIAKWDGATWSDVGGGVGASGGGPCVSQFCRIESFAVYDDGTGPALYVSGGFESAGGVPVERIARWDGTAWSALAGGGFNSGASDLQVFDDGTGPALFAGGAFTKVGTTSVVGLAKWAGSAWEEVGGGRGSGGFNTAGALEVYDDGTGPVLFAGGNVSFVGAAQQPVNNIVSWDGSAWSTLGEGQGVHDIVRAFGAFDDGSGAKLFAGGDFVGAGQVPAEHVACWDGTSWDSLQGGGVINGSSVYTFETFDDGSGSALYVGGAFAGIGGTGALYVARYDSSGWSKLGAGLSHRVHALAAFDDGGGPNLYAGGLFNSGGLSRIARWTGTDWVDVGGGVDSAVYALEVWDDGGGPALYAGGVFTTAGGMPAQRIARWDGASWSPLGPGLSATTATPEVNALAVFDDGAGPALFAAGRFRTAGALAVERVAKWDGAAWSALGSGLGARAHALAVFDPGGGEQLYVGGQFTLAGGAPAAHLARWDGSSWSKPLGGSIDDDVYALAAFDDGTGAGPSLFAGGDFTLAGGRRSYRVARATCSCTGATYCVAGTTASGCNALVSATGSASRSSPTGFVVAVAGGEGQKDGMIYFGTNGAQAGAWGNGTSLQCVVPPAQRTGIQQGVGTAGGCDNLYQLDFNAWMSANPVKAPPAGGVAYLQCWFRDPASTSNRGTSLSDALSFGVCP